MESAGGLRKEDAPADSVSHRQEKPLSQVRERDSRGPLQEQDVADKPTQAHVPAVEQVRRPAPPMAGPAARELRVKVWPQENLAESARPEREQTSVGSSRTETERAGAENALDDLPTRPLVANPPTPPVQSTHKPSLASMVQESVSGDVELLNTNPLAAPEASESRSGSSPTRVSVDRAGQVEQRPWQAAGRGDVLDRPSLRSSQPVTPPARPVVQPQQSRFGPVSPVPPVSPLPPLASAQQDRQAPVMPPPFPAKTGMGHQAKQSRRTPMLVLLAVLLILIIGGLSTWIIAFHPFTVPTVTQPQQTFSNTQLGFSVLYPSGWTAKADTGKGIASFTDSSHTGRVEIAVSTVSGDLNQSLAKEESGLGLTGVKAGKTLSFAGTSWQQAQGSMQVSGANFTVVLLAAVHGSHIYTIIQMAPQVTYTEEDQLIFSSMRSSFHFLP